mgnify:FL=1
MRVLHLNAGNETGGGMVHILTLLNQIKSDNIFLGLFEEGVFYEKALNSGIQTVTFTQKNRYDLSVLSRVVRFIYDSQIDIIHTHGPRANLYGYLIKKKTGVTWMCTVHSDPRNDFLGRGIQGAVFTKLNIAVLKKADHLFAISERFKEMLIDFQIAPQKITTIYNGINFNDKRTYNLDELRKELNLDKTDFVIVMVARFDPVKRHSLAIRSLERVVKNNPELSIKMLLIGDGPEKKDIEEEVERLGLNHNVLFLGYQNDVAKYYQLADVTLLTSKTESFPLVLLESAREYTPVITTDVGGVGKMIPSAEYGFIVKSDDEEHIAETIQKAIELNKKNLLEKMGTKFYEYTSANFSVNSFAESIITTYKEYLSSGRGSNFNHG